MLNAKMYSMRPHKNSETYFNQFQLEGISSLY